MNWNFFVPTMFVDSNQLFNSPRSAMYHALTSSQWWNMCKTRVTGRKPWYFQGHVKMLIRHDCVLMVSLGACLITFMLRPNWMQAAFIKWRSSIKIPFLHYSSLICALLCRSTIWLSTAPTQPLTHWYQVRCLLQTPLFVKQGQSLVGKVHLRSNKRWDT